METGLLFGWRLAPGAEITISYWGWSAEPFVNLFDIQTSLIPSYPGPVSISPSGDPASIIFVNPPCATLENGDPNGNTTFTYFFRLKNVSTQTASAYVRHLTVASSQ
jgi:hypothetical protein